MPQLIIPGCFQVSIIALAAGREIVNVIGVQNASGNTTAATTAVKTAWEAANGPLARLSSVVTMSRYHGVDIGSGSGSIVDVASTGVGGTGSAPLSTRAASALVKWNGGTRDRSSRGRLYYGPLNETNINNDGATLPGATVTTFTTTFENFRLALVAAGYPLVVLSRVKSQAYPVTSVAVENTIATQRRRIRS